MKTAPPIPCVWLGDSFVPTSKHWARLADQHFVVHATYLVEAREERSVVSHRHYFAAINEAWQNLPDELAVRFASADHLRRYALIRAGFHDERSIVCASKAEALRVAAFVKPADEYALVIVKEAVVLSYTAKSQSQRAMGREEFQRSKQAVLEILSEMIGTTTKALAKAAEQA